MPSLLSDSLFSFQSTGFVASKLVKLKTIKFWICGALLIFAHFLIFFPFVRHQVFSKFTCRLSHCNDSRVDSWSFDSSIHSNLCACAWWTLDCCVDWRVNCLLDICLLVSIDLFVLDVLERIWNHMWPPKLSGITCSTLLTHIEQQSLTSSAGFHCSDGDRFIFKCTYLRSTCTQKEIQ